MAVQIPIYQQQTAPDTLGFVPRAEAPRIDDSAARAGQNLAGAMMSAADTYARVKQAEEANRKREEAEDGKAWSAAQAAKAHQRAAQLFITMTDSAESGAAGFAEKYESEFDKISDELLAEAPTDTARNFLQERIVPLRSQFGINAISFQAEERRKWRAQQSSEGIDRAAAVVASNYSPQSYATIRAEQKAVIESMDIPPEAKRAQLEKLDLSLSTSAVLGEIERDPQRALNKLSARLGVDPAQATSVDITSDTVWKRMIHQESRGQQFGRNGQPLRSPKGATGIAQIMPETGPEAARYAGLPWDAERFKSDKDYNLALGRAYFDKQVADFGSPMLAAAAYNAGPAIVRDWINGTNDSGKNPSGRKLGNPARGEISPAEFVRRIPFKETREYVEAFAPSGPTVAEAIAPRADGGPIAPPTGDPAYDALSVSQVVQLLGKASQGVEQDRTKYRSYVATREADDMAAFQDGKAPAQPLTVGEYVHAFGDVEGVRKYETYRSAQNYAGALQALKTASPAEIEAELRRREPKAGPGYAAQSQLYQNYQRAAAATVKARDDDPIAFAENAGIADVAPIKFSGGMPQDDIAAELKNRFGVATSMTTKYGTRFTLLKRDEVEDLSAAVNGMTWAEKAEFMKTVRSGISNDQAFLSVLQQLRPDSPVTATAGSIMSRVEGSELAKKNAMLMLQGEDLLNPAKAAEKKDGKGGAFPMPSDDKLRQQWTKYTGNAYSADPDTESASYQAFRAVYAALSARSGDYDGGLDANRARAAAEAATGGIVNVNGNSIVLPYGLRERDVRDELVRQWDTVKVGTTYARTPFASIDLVTVGDGEYSVFAGSGPLRGTDGKPLRIRVKRSDPWVSYGADGTAYRRPMLTVGFDEQGRPIEQNIAAPPTIETPIPAAPASSYSPIPGWKPNE